GHPIIQTPHIDQLAYHGLNFEQAYSPTPICIPARSIIMSGIDGPGIGLTSFKPGFEIPTEETIPKLLGDAGYQTKAVGKMHFYPERKHYGFDQMTLWEEGRALGKEFGISGDYGDYESWLAEEGYAGQSYGHGISNNEYTMSPWHLP